MGERTVKESVSGDLCRPIVPERLWMIYFFYQCVTEVSATLSDSPG